MRKIIAGLLLLAPLLAACGKDAPPLVPELKGRWASVDLNKRAQSTRPQPVSAQVTQRADNDCSVHYVAFEKRGIVLHVFGIGVPIFDISEVKRDRSRLTLVGKMDKASAGGTIELLLRNGEVKFDDISDPRGRSVRYERLPDGHPMRKYGANTIGDAMQLFLDVKPCRA